MVLVEQGPIASASAIRNRAGRPDTACPRRTRGIQLVVVAAALCAYSVAPLRARQDVPQGLTPPAPLRELTLADAQTHFYNARYRAAAEMALTLRSPGSADLANDELRSSALLFQLKALLETPGEKHVTAEKRDKERALKNCATCPELMTEFFDDVHHGQNLARARLKANPRDPVALFYLGKLDLNYVWLQLGPLGRKTGWDEYWEARRSLDAVLKTDPQHVRALVARAWIDYIVDTKMPWGTRWILGGGSRKRALAAVRQAAVMESEFFTHTEAEFALWDMQVREHDLVPAREVAQRLAASFPDNREVASFLADRDANVRR
jgi:hypothetical protein